MSYLASWSGGKDSCLACYKAMLDGYNISHIVNSISEKYQRVRFHGSEAKMMQLQAESLGIPLLQKETTDDGYEQEFKEAIRSLIPNGIKGMIFGDIYLDGAKEWAEKICDDLGIEAVEPLWGKDTEEVLTEFIDSGFEAVIVGAQSEFVDKKWVGQQLNKSFIEHLKDKGADICGENGEYHTLVVNGPIFSKRIEITESETIHRDGYWFLDTREYRLIS